MFRRILALLLVLVMVALFTASCGQSSKPQSAEPLVWGMHTDIETLNPIFTESANEANILNAIFSTLIKVNDELEFEPYLLEEMPVVSQDGLTYQFKLREGIKFHDGVELTAEDVKFTYEMKMAEKNAVPSRLRWERIANFEIIDKYTFYITLKEPDITWLEGWAYAESMIVPKHILEAEFIQGGNELSKGGNFSRKPIGSGPYRFVEWKANEFVMLEAFTDYFRGKPQIEKIVFKVVPDLNTMLARFSIGEIDIYDRAAPDHYRQLLKLQEDGMPIEVHNFPSFMSMNAIFNMRLPVFQDRAVRQALNYAFPKERFIDVVLDGVATVAHADTPPMSWAYNPNLKEYEHNPEKAVQLLREAGWKLGEDGVFAKNGVRLSFTINTNTGNPVREAFQEIAKQEWEAIGAEVFIQNYEAATLFGDILRNLKFDMIVLGSAAGIDPDSKTLWHSSQRPELYGTGQNFAGFSNQRIDELLEAGLKETSQEARVAIYHEVQQILSQEVPYLFICFFNSITAVPANLENFRPNPTLAGNAWNIFEWKLN
ncbi:MAG: peptide-binding protein [Dethiobacter sp.]|nr:peptide-binding protein [Dethiobacter sp.]MBS3990137.1 peptide-binding protein [Dethiobacter sp.]